MTVDRHKSSESGSRGNPPESPRRSTPPGAERAEPEPGNPPQPAFQGKQDPPKQDRRTQVRVPNHLQDLISGIPITPEDVDLFRRKRLLNALIHRLLTVGLLISTAIMIAGIVLDIVSRQQMPRKADTLSDAVTGVFSFQWSPTRPAGLLSLGLLILIATPIMRVLGSFIAFLHERDWRYVGITFLVVVILFVSIMSGAG